MDRRAHLAALQEQSKFAEDEAKLLAAQRETELKLKQLDIAKQMAIARAELAVYEDEEVTFPKSRQQVVSSWCSMCKFVLTVAFALYHTEFHVSVMSMM